MGYLRELAINGNKGISEVDEANSYCPLKLMDLIQCSARFKRSVSSKTKILLLRANASVFLLDGAAYNTTSATSVKLVLHTGLFPFLEVNGRIDMPQSNWNASCHQNEPKGVHDLLISKNKPAL